MIQVIEKQFDSWHMIVNDLPITFTKQLQLFTDGLLPINPDCRNGLRWRINSKWVSYNQIKKAINESKLQRL